MEGLVDTGRQRKLLILYLFIGNVAADCPNPDHGEFTVLTEESLLKSTFPDGTVITYQCRLGYEKVNGTTKMNCVGGKWTEPDIICRKKDCGFPIAQPHMLFDTSQGTLFGATVKVTCEEGFRINGSSFKECIDTGWFKTANCVVVTCSKPTKVENGEHSWNSDNKPKNQQTINFTCNAGYTLFGSESIRCTKTGQYDSEPPQCIADCPKPQHVENTILTPDSLLKSFFPGGTVITYECINGYGQISGTGIIRCVDGKWTKLDIICKRYCPVPQSVENMVLTDESLLRKDFTEGTSVTYECANGFKKESGSEIITCINGNWTEPDLVCKRNTPLLSPLLIFTAVCCAVGFILNIFCVWKQCSYDTGEELTSALLQPQTL